ncbi:MAG TPA: hypothetical protein VFX79_03735 [Candidatus Saccharimonadales bacterium]|nr:hypothetical protein [Candidatus Saccharimonadales bacterium]
MEPVYDPHKTFDDNFDNGPFGKFASGDGYKNKGEPENKFLGFPVYEPFGIAAGPLPNSKHTTAAFNNGYDVVVYKTQRTVPVQANQFPNIVPIDTQGDVTLEQAEKGLVVRDEFNEDPTKLTITNSFGNPSRGPEYWVDDAKQALAGQGKGQILVVSVCGTIQKNQTQDEYFQDFANAAKQAYEAGVNLIELNLSCPNVANEGIICYTPEAVKSIVNKTRVLVPDAKLILKFGYFSKQQQSLLEQIINSIADKADAISTINTIPAAVYKKDGTQALPGEGRLKSGLCGAGIKWAGLDMVKRLDTIRKKNDYKFEIVGVGGVMTPNDYKKYREAGADCVQACTGPMWNPGLAAQIKTN